MHCVPSMEVCIILLTLFTLRALCIPEYVVQSSGYVMGKVTFYQTEGNSTYSRNSGELAAKIPTMISFELSDHQRNLRTLKFTYTWDLGNGNVVVGSDPVLHCSYTSSGNYTFKLNVGADINTAIRLTGLHSMNLIVLDAITSIELRGPLSYSVNQNSSLTFEIAGSLPAWLCWRVLPKCRAFSRASCKLVRLYDRQFKLNHTFESVGTHCLDLSVQNEVSRLQTSYSVYVQKSPMSLLIFILPCASVIIATIIFISISVCRPQQKLLKSKAQGEALTYQSFEETEIQAEQEDTPDGLPSLNISEKNRK